MFSTASGRRPWHVDDRLLVKLLRGPGNAPSVVAVCGCGEGDPADTLLRLMAGKIGEIDVVRTQAQLRYIRRAAA